MRVRPFGATSISEVGLGCWQLGGADWGDVSESDALATLHAAVEAGTTFFDTADVYGLGRSEQLIGTFLKQTSRPVTVATKVGRFPSPGGAANLTPAGIQAHVDACRARLGVDALDLVQLHCIPTAALADGAVFDTLRDLQRTGSIHRFGASVESAAEADLCLKQEGLASLQVIFNIFRQTPAETFFATAQAKKVGIIVRLPLASGLLAGKYTPATTFPANDHRNYNRDGAKFNVGETFAGLPFETGLTLAQRLQPLVPPGLSMAQMALRWCLDFPAVTTIIPGARNPAQARANAAVSDLPPLGDDLHRQLRAFWQTEVRSAVRGPD